MSMTDQQKTLLALPLNRASVKTREQGGRTLSYIEGWAAIAEANRIFGFDGWQRETVFIQCASDQPREIGRDKVPGFGVTYVAKVKVTVDGIVREGCGAGHGIDRDHGQAHESAIKEAETDAMKRALMTFGNPFGLALYDKQQTNVADDPPPPPPETAADIAAREEYIKGCKGTINDMAPEKLFAWWTSETQKANRRKFNLSKGEVEVLKAMVIAKRETINDQAGT